MTERETFHVRTYAKSELAQMYFPSTVSPETATAHLRQWIRRNRELSHRLELTGYTPTDKYFTPRQVAEIVEILGEP